MDRILALPDLAGLSRCRTPPRARRPYQGIKRSRRHEEWEPSSQGGYKRRKKMRYNDEHELDDVAAREQNSLEAPSPVSSVDPSDERRIAHISGVKAAGRNGYLRGALYAWENSRDLYMEQDIDVSYSQFEAGIGDVDAYGRDPSDGFGDTLAADTSSSYYQQSSQSLLMFPQPELRSVRSQLGSAGTSGEDLPTMPTVHRPSRTLSSSFGNDVTDASSAKDDLPDDPPIASPNAPCLSFASDNLYEHEDPWHTIGVILGLSPLSQNNSHTLVYETHSDAYAAEPWQDDQRKTSMHLGNSLSSSYVPSLSSRGYSPSDSDRFDLDQDEKSLRSITTSHGYSSSYGSQCSSSKKKNPRIGTPHVNQSPCWASPSVFGRASLLDEGKDEQVTFDTGEPLRFDSPTLKRESGVPKSPKTREALSDTTEAEQPSNEPDETASTRFKGTSCAGLPARIGAEESDKDTVHTGRPLNVYQGLCLFPEDAESDRILVVDSDHVDML